MLNPTYSPDLRLLLPETVWLEPEHFLLAQKISSSDTTNLNDSWQAYLNALALLAFEQWLCERLPNKVISKDASFIETAGNLKVDDFKFCAIATEHLLDEVAKIPQAVIEKPEYSAHFYVLLEVLEEEEEVIIRGFLPYKQLIEIKSSLKLSVDEGCYQLPLSLFDMEPSHLLVYQRYVQASEFALPVVDSRVTQVSENLSKLVNTTTTKLSQWLQGVIDEAWQTIDSISNPELNLAFSTRNVERATKKAKIIDLGIDLGNRKVALLVNISPDKSADSKDESSEDKISVLAQLYPMSGEKYLPHNIKFLLISKAGKTLQEVTSRIQDNYIQLKPFKGQVGKHFSIQITLEGFSFKENFEL
ncbi:MAG: DUF1822 family protein [Rivularia sp. (in: cyanobacteria)]